MNSHADISSKSRGLHFFSELLSISTLYVCELQRLWPVCTCADLPEPLAAQLCGKNRNLMHWSISLTLKTGPKVIKLFSCSTQLSMKFQLLIPTNEKFIALSLSDVVFIMLINVKMPTIVGILTFVSRINFMLI